jgi:DNA invertase Pin-like site-specific DNA recombinase
MKIAAAYIRVSTDDQVEYSPESQRKALYAYAKAHDMIIPEEYVFADEGISGRSTRRPAFQRMIGTAKLRPAPFEVILVWKFSRFARNREDSIVYKSMLRKQCGIEVVSVSEPVGEDKTSILIEALLEAMDEYYSINLAEEVVRGMSEKARRGGTLGRLAFGYRSEQGKAVIDDEKADIVRKIFRDFDAGVPIKRIASELNDLGIRNGNGRLWEGRTIEYIVRNPFYIGSTHWTPEKVKGKHAETISLQTIVTENTHPAIIDRELFDRCQDRVAENKRTHIYKEHETHGKMFALKGLVRCSACGATLVSGGSNGVQCHMYAKGACKQSHFISKPKLDAMVIAQMEEDFRNGSFTVQLDAQIAEPDEADVLTDQAVTRLEMQLSRVKEAYAAGIDTLEEYRENKARILDQIETVRSKAKPRRIVHRSAELLRNQSNALTSAIALYKSDVSEDAKHTALKCIISSVVFDSKRKSVAISYRL